MPNCPDCNHPLGDNNHGPDQNDYYVDENNDYKHIGTCTYCKYCNSILALPVAEKAETERGEPSKESYEKQILRLEQRLHDAMGLLRTMKELLEDHGHSQHCGICKDKIDAVNQFLNGGGK